LVQCLHAGKIVQHVVLQEMHSSSTVGRNLCESLGRASCASLHTDIPLFQAETLPAIQAPSCTAVDPVHSQPRVPMSVRHGMLAMQGSVCSGVWVSFSRHTRARTVRCICCVCMCRRAHVRLTKAKQRGLTEVAGYAAACCCNANPYCRSHMVCLPRLAPFLDCP
jgi:hypothetical protein